MKATFEEKTYENYFNVELDRLTSIFFPIGQVQEGNLGFDSSALSKNRKLWNLLGYPFGFLTLYKGIELREIANEMERNLGIIINSIPSMKANLLFQYKRPEYIAKSNGSEWKHWKVPYFRYTIYKEQQDLLMQIDKKFSSDVLVLYASPAAQDINELVSLKLSRNIISNSNFKKSADLHAHHRNTYIKSGTFSIACSEPVSIKNFDLLPELESIGRNSDFSIKGGNRRFIIEFRQIMEELTYQNQYYGSSLKSLNSEIAQFQDLELLYSFLVMSNFRLMTGIQWIVKL